MNPEQRHILSDDERKRLVEDMRKASDEASEDASKLKIETKPEPIPEAGPEDRTEPEPPKKIYKKAKIARRLEPTDEVPKDWLTRWQNEHEG